ncbi:hypothetical protein T4D_1310 [Trichinella pseudospiralis]|uniref:Uncharacterized protein n=1 Tax=Trichinella pseudospiralis TaxID=6337 RepID=A0A0V1FTC7_TRIPS|nr:hypothetical protein T4D_1310 [Trichinella pseudospiralis]
MIVIQSFNHNRIYSDLLLRFLNGNDELYCRKRIQFESIEMKALRNKRIFFIQLIKALFLTVISLGKEISWKNYRICFVLFDQALLVSSYVECIYFIYLKISQCQEAPLIASTKSHSGLLAKMFAIRFSIINLYLCVTVCMFVIVDSAVFVFAMFTVTVACKVLVSCRLLVVTEEIDSLLFEFCLHSVMAQFFAVTLQRLVCNENCTKFLYP